MHSPNGIKASRKPPAMNSHHNGARYDVPPLHPNQPASSHRSSSQPQLQAQLQQQQLQLQQQQMMMINNNGRRQVSNPNMNVRPQQIPQQAPQQIPVQQPIRNVTPVNTPNSSSRIPSAGKFSQNEEYYSSPNQRMDPTQLLERQLRDIFDRVDRNRDGRLSEDELSAALLNNDGSHFRPSTIKLMIRLFDKDGSNSIDFREFYHLWNYLIHWRKEFNKYDLDQNEKISFGEYQATLESFGYRLPTDIVLFVFQKFGDFNANQPMSLKFDMFVESLIWLLRCTNIFKKFDKQGNGVATIPFQDFVHEILMFI